MLVDLLMNASRMGMDLAGRLESADFNPIVVWGISTACWMPR